MIKVCHITSAHPSKDGRIFARECVALSKAGYDVYLVEQGVGTELIDGVNIVRYGNIAGYSRIKRMTIAARKAYTTALGLDARIYHLHDPELLPYAVKLKRKGKLVVFDIHENYVEQIKTKPYLSPIAGRFISSFFYYYSRHVYKKLDGLTYPGRAEEENPYSSFNDKIVTTDNVPELNDFYYRYKVDVQKYPRSICYFGNISSDRGLSQMVAAAKKADCTLYIGGNFSSMTPDEMQATITDSNVNYLGVLTREQVVDQLLKCQIGLCLLQNVGQYYQMKNLPTKIYEYMALGLPVIFSDSPYNKAFNDLYQIGICVNPLDVSQIVEAINFLLDNPSLARQFGDNGRNAIKTVYNWDVEKLNLLHLYEMILKD